MSDLAAPTSSNQQSTGFSTGNGAVPSASPSMFSGLQDPKNSYDITGTQKPAGGSFPSWQYQNWSAKGSGFGNRTADTPQVDAKKPGDPAKVANASMGAPSVAQADLTGIQTQSSNNGGDGFYHDSTIGTYMDGAEGSAKWGGGKYGKDGLGGDLYKWRAAAGAREQIGVRGHVGDDEKTFSKDDGGHARAKGDASLLAEAGADANFKVGKDGVQANANASVRAGASVNGDADAVYRKTIDGVTDPLVAQAGVHADGFAGVKAGVGLKAGIGPTYTGIEGKAGAMAGAEANADVHAKLGPLGAKLGVSGIAGAGIEASGGITYENGQLHIGGKFGAALGLGGSVSFDATLDVRQTVQLLKKAGMAMTPENIASLGAAGMKGVATGAEKGWNGVKDFLDPENTGHFSMHGLGVRAQRIGHGIEEGMHDAKDWAGAKLHDAKDWAKEELKNAGKGLSNAAHSVGHALTHPGETLHNAKDWAGQKAHDIGQGLHNAKDWAGAKLHDAKDWAGAKLHDAKDWAGDKLHQAGDAAKYALTHPGEMMNRAKDWAGGKLHDAGQALSNAKDWAGDKLHDAKDWAGAKLHDAKDWAGDKLHQAGDAAKFALAHPGQALNNAKDWAGDKLHDAGQGLSNAKDWASDKLHGAKDAVVSGASSLYQGAKSQVGNAVNTLSSGAHDAWGSLKHTGSDIKHFFGF